MIEQNKENVYIDELKKYQGSQVDVFNNEGKKFSGICKAISFIHLNIVIMNNDEKILIKNISHIIRKRSNPKPVEIEEKKDVKRTKNKV